MKLASRRLLLLSLIIFAALLLFINQAPYADSPILDVSLAASLVTISPNPNNINPTPNINLNANRSFELSWNFLTSLTLNQYTTPVVIRLETATIPYNYRCNTETPAINDAFGNLVGLV